MDKLDEKKYYLCLSENQNLPQGSVVGEFRHRDNLDFCFYIILHNETLEQTNNREIVVSPNRVFNGRSCAIAFVTEEFLKKLQRRDFNLASLWHELGHIHYDDYEKNKTMTSREISIIRKQHILDGRVTEDEIRADEFASRNFGKKEMIKFLKSSIQGRKKLNDRNSDLAIREIQLRINHLNSYLV